LKACGQPSRMGCQSSQCVETAACEALPRCITPLTSPTILASRSIDLPTVEVQVLKDVNARRLVMAAPEQPPHLEPDIASALEQIAAATRQVQCEQMEGPAAPLQNMKEAAPDMKYSKLSGEEANNTSSSEPESTLPETLSISPDEAIATFHSYSPTQRGTPICDCWSDNRTDSSSRRKRAKGADPGAQLEHLIEELFRAHDLNSDGLLDEMELIQLNEAVAEVHDSSNTENIQQKYSVLFREKLDPEGRPVPVATFRAYMLEMLDEIDRNEVAQEMIVEQFLAEARLARTVVTGDPLLVDRPRPPECYYACLRYCPAGEVATEVRA